MVEGFKHLAFFLVRLNLPYPVPLLSSILGSALAYFVYLDLRSLLIWLYLSTLQREYQDGMMHKSYNVNLCNLYTLQRAFAVVYYRTEGR